MFGIFPNEDREFVTFKTGIPGGPGLVSTRILSNPTYHKRSLSAITEPLLETDKIIYLD